MLRRAFMLASATSLAQNTRNAVGQVRRLPVVGFLNSAAPDLYSFNVVAFRDGLRESGFVEGETVRLEYRWARGDYHRLPELAAELVDAKVNVIAATGDVGSARAAQSATSTIPIVFTVGSNPVRFGLVASLSRPAGNATGITLFSSTLTVKRLEILRDVLPDATLIALLMNPANPNVDADVSDARDAASSLGRRTVTVSAESPEALASAFAHANKERVGAMLVASDPLFLSQRERLVSLSAEHKIPVMYWSREFALAGGLIAYGTSTTWMYRQAGLYCGQILKGAKAADLPVLQPSRFELFINSKTAKALGIAVPQQVLVRADEVVQ